MSQTIVPYFRIIITLLMILKPFIFVSASSIFQALNIHCDRPWENEEESYSLDLTTSASLCASPQNVAKCTLVKCRALMSNCEMIKIPSNVSFHCIRNSAPAEKNVFLRNEFIREQRTELAIVDIHSGHFELVTDETISPISIPSIGAQTPLQIQWDHDILSCALNTVECRLWIERTSKWVSFPNLSHVHWGGTLSLVGKTPIVIGGKFQETYLSTHGIVEIYNQKTHEWTLGPSLDPVRYVHFTVVLNETSLVVIGGYNSAHLRSVKMLNIQDLNWTELDDLIYSTYSMACGLVDGTLILCIGGEQPGKFANTAFELDMSISNPEWKAKPSFNIEQPALGGFIFQLRSHLYCMTTLKTGFEHSSILRKMNLEDTNPTWEVIEVYPNELFCYVLPYVTSGYTIRH